MCQQSADLQSRKAKLKKSAYMLAALFFCIVGIVFAWFTNSTTGKIDTLTMTFAGSPLSATTSYYALDETYTVASEADEPSDGVEVLSEDIGSSQDGEYEYQVISGENGFSVAVNPGERILFKTEISNAGLADKRVSLYLTGCSYSTLLQDAVRIGVLQEDSAGTTVAKEIEVTGEMVTEVTEGENPGCYLESVLLAEDIAIPAGDGTSPGTVTIDWYILIDGNEVGNECQDAWLVIGQLQMAVKE
jgi:hypothetical protein